MRTSIKLEPVRFGSDLKPDGPRVNNFTQYEAAWFRLSFTIRRLLAGKENMSVSLSTSPSVWTLDLGENENLFSPKFLTEIDQALDAITNSSEPAALMITATGKFFSNGLDLASLQPNDGEWDTHVLAVQSMFARVLTLPVPTVCAINGHCFAAGAMLALACDYRVMRTERGFFCIPAIDLKIPLAVGMVSLIQSKLTLRTAFDVMTTGWRYDAPAARESGIVDAICDAKDLINVAKGMVANLAGKDRATLGTIKSTMYAGVVTDLAGPLS
jgi:enoyl-CoA hydratase/carnithine racemase